MTIQPINKHLKNHFQQLTFFSKMISSINGQKDCGAKKWWQLKRGICQEDKKPTSVGWSDIQNRGLKIGVYGHQNQNLRARETI